MKQTEILFWEFLQRVALRVRLGKAAKDLPLFPLDATGQAACNVIKSRIVSGRPLMVARFGAGEIAGTARYLQMQKRFNPLAYLLGNAEPNWWTKDLRHGLENNAGIFNISNAVLTRFGQMMVEDACFVDVLGCWQPKETLLSKELSSAVKVRLEDLEPYYHVQPWSIALKGKKVLVVHPFAHSIESQYKNRAALFENANVLPDFNLITMRAVQSIAASQVSFNSWFDALDHMKDGISNISFDIAIIGCGAYGFPLAAHVKRMGKQAIHLGGATQILFGIKGKRWEALPFFTEKIFNSHWVRPQPEETPEKAEEIEAACYW